jgi:uncharacterized membrane protein YqaE (UPF0057 family)
LSDDVIPSDPQSRLSRDISGWPSRVVENTDAKFRNITTYTNIGFSDICKILLAIILPPVGVFLERGCGADFFINILLTILGKSLLNSSSLHPIPPEQTHTIIQHYPHVLLSS